MLKFLFRTVKDTDRQLKKAFQRMANWNLMKLKGTAKLTPQHHFMTPWESKFTHLEILPIQENFPPDPAGNSYTLRKRVNH